MVDGGPNMLGLKMAPHRSARRLSTLNPLVSGYPDLNRKFMLGPQTFAGTFEVAGRANVETYHTSRISEFVTKFSPATYATQSGTIAVTNGSAVFNVSGGSITGLLHRSIKILGSTTRRYFIQEVTSSTQGKLGIYSYGAGDYVTSNWPDANQSGLTWKLDDRTLDTDGESPIDWWSGVQANYYDIVHALYQAWAKFDNSSSTSTILANARTIADAIIDTNWGTGFDEGRGSLNMAPREGAMLGMIDRALDGRSELWDRIYNYVDEIASTWLDRYKTGGSPGTHITSARDAGYTLLFCATLGYVAPDGTQRTHFRDLAEAYAADPIIRDMNTDLDAAGGGHWKHFTTYQDYLDAGNGVTSDTWDGTQANWHGTNAIYPFLETWCIAGLRQTHRMMRYLGRTGQAAYTTIGNALVTAGSGRINIFRRPELQNFNNPPEEAIAYVATDLTTDKVQSGATHNEPVFGNDNGQGPPLYDTASQPNFGYCQEQRTQNHDGIGNLGYIAALSGGQSGIYGTQCTREIAACFQYGPTSDGVHPFSLWLQSNIQRKAWSQFWGAGEGSKSFGWLAAGLNGDSP